MRPSMPLLVVSMLLLGGCAAAMPGYVPPSDRRDKMLAAAPKGGGIDSQGTYQLSDQEQKLDCKQLSGSITIKIMQMREAGDRRRASLPAALAQHASRPFQGNSTYGADIDADAANDRARLVALNRQLAAKNCRTFDIEADLKPGNKDMPRPVGEVKPKTKAGG
ncbi:MAG: hypothetical protein ACKVP7_23465 [Hyphomicrobiaceae bacterium]